MLLVKGICQCDRCGERCEVMLSLKQHDQTVLVNNYDPEYESSTSERNIETTLVRVYGCPPHWDISRNGHRCPACQGIGERKK
jgi:hypothetical protein